MFVKASVNGLSVKAYRGDAKTLLAFNLSKTKAKGLAGFTIGYTVGGATHYVGNTLQFEDPALHSQDPHYAADSSINAPLHKFRWVHIPGPAGLAAQPAYGTYTYLVTPRYLGGGALLALDPALTVSLAIEVGPFTKGALTAAFTRGFTQSEAFVHRFGADAVFRPAGDDLLYATSATSGTTPSGTAYTFAQEYAWLGFSARATVLQLLADVQHDAALSADVFAYDLDEPDVVSAFLALAADGRIRMILDNSSLHHSTTKALPEDEVETRFVAAAKAPAAIKRGKFARYSHDKVMVVYRTDGAGTRSPVKVLTGSTNFSITGLYVNSNHVLVFDDPAVAAAYGQVFEDSWAGNVMAGAFRKTAEAGQPSTFATATVPATSITFSPHSATYAGQILDGLSARIKAEAGQAKGSVLFAVMELNSGTGSVYPTLNDLHADPTVFSYGISDSPKGIYLYTPRSKTGVLVTGKPGQTQLPPPFDQVPSPKDHQVHHKFVVCGFNGTAPVVYCGSSNLALGGETDNGDNLIAISDGDVATVFAIEALTLVNHFDFLDSRAAHTAAAAPAPWYLSTTDKWTAPYFDPTDLHYADRLLFG